MTNRPDAEGKSAIGDAPPAPPTPPALFATEDAKATPPETTTPNIDHELQFALEGVARVRPSAPTLGQADAGEKTAANSGEQRTEMGDADEQEDPPLTTASPMAQHLGAPPRRSFSWAGLVLVLLTVATAVFGIVMGRHWLKSRQWRRRVSGALQHQGSAPKSRGVLRVNVQGREHDLGPVERLAAVHVGSGSRNAVRISHAKIEPRLLRLFWRRGKLWLKNLAAHDVRVGDTVLKRRRRCAVDLPLTVDLGRGLAMKLQLIRPQT